MWGVMWYLNPGSTEDEVWGWGWGWGWMRSGVAIMSAHRLVDAGRSSIMTRKMVEPRMCMYLYVAIGIGNLQLRSRH
jgi:hypothetical protein